MTMLIFIVTFYILPQELNYCLNPEMMDKILRVLKDVGKDLHANQIQNYYHKQIASHQQCEECNANVENSME